MTELGTFECGAYTVTVAARTDVGKVRSVNEDNYVVSPRVWAVSDGMGGHEAGDVASQIVIDVCGEAGAGGELSIADVGGMVVRANAAVRQHAARNGRDGMGATLVGFAIAENGDDISLVVFNVGDSRCYELVGDSLMRQLTTDHSLVQEMVDAGEITAEEAETHPRRNVITRGIGIDPHVLADLIVLEPEASRRLVLCSDGVSGEIGSARLASISSAGSDPGAVADGLLAATLEGPARDNATVVVADIEWSGAAVAGGADDLDESTGPRPNVADETTAPREQRVEDEVAFDDPEPPEASTPEADEPTKETVRGSLLIADVPSAPPAAVEPGTSSAPVESDAPAASLIDEVPK